MPEREWDDEKNQQNRRKHGFDFHDAPMIFIDYHLEKLDIRTDYGEDRWIVLGFVRGVIAVLVYTERDGKLRPISLRKATAAERRVYEEARYERLGKN
jgi:uncharacterized DUF497 family protein